MNALRVAGFGLTLGFVISRLGVSDFGEVHRMVTFADPRLWLVFASTVALAALGFRVVLPRIERRFPKSRVHRGTVVGAMLFGVGWSLTGACPTVVPVQIGEGRWPALLTAAGILAGTWIYGRLHARYFKWDMGSCDF